MDWVEVEALMTPGDVSPAIVRRPAWQRRAACRGIGPTLFFARHGDDGTAVQTGKNLCQRCPVQQECLEFAMADPLMQGTWGGTSERARSVMRRASA